MNSTRSLRRLSTRGQNFFHYYKNKEEFISWAYGRSSLGSSIREMKAFSSNSTFFLSIEMYVGGMDNSEMLLKRKNTTQIKRHICWANLRAQIWVSIKIFFRFSPAKGHSLYVFIIKRMCRNHSFDLISESFRITPLKYYCELYLKVIANNHLWSWP